MDKLFSREELIQDIRQLSEIIETAHPEPYFKGGGKIAYHRRLQTLIRSIPPEGMHKTDFLIHLMPFVAQVKDGHTAFFLEDQSLDPKNPGGIPLMFGAIQEQLYVKAVVHEEHQSLFGSLLVAVEGIPFEELVIRIQNLVGCENRYQALGKLGNDPAFLYHRKTLKLLIPEWQQQTISVTLQHPDSTTQEHIFEPAADIDHPLLTFQELSHLSPITNKANRFFFYRFLEDQPLPPESIAYLRISNMITFREAYEYFHANRMDNLQQWAKNIYPEFNTGELPSVYTRVIEGLPAASDVFLNLFTEMKQAQTQYLIVDLRNNGGGNSLFNQIFTYFLVGFEKTLDLLITNGTVRKLSPFLKSTSENGLDLENIPYFNTVPLTETDYDFNLDPHFAAEALRASFREQFVADFKKMPSFIEEFQSRQHEALYFPNKIFVLCSENTFSTGYNLMVDLYLLGAEIVGIPSGQAGNSCGDIRHFTLEQTELKGMVSTKAFTAFPDDSEKGKLLHPHHPLTYRKFKTYNFDENATLRFALEIIKNQAAEQDTF